MDDSKISLREYVDKLFEQSERAISKAEKSMTERLAGMNEFRDALKDQASRFVTRPETALMLKPLEKTIDEHDKQIRSLELTRSELAGKASQASVTITLFLSLFGLILGIIGLLS